MTEMAFDRAVCQETQSARHSQRFQLQTFRFQIYLNISLLSSYSVPAETCTVITHDSLYIGDKLFSLSYDFKHFSKKERLFPLITAPFGHC